MSIICKCNSNNQEEIFEFEKVARQSNGSVLLQVGKTVILATVVSEFDHPIDDDFIPLTVQYIEKTYANAKFNGGFVKREAKPSDFEILTSRIIDRSLRPLFPQGYAFPTVITVMVLSVDEDVDLQVLALNAASAALFTSNLPINKSIASARVGLINGEYIINPSSSQLLESSLDLYIVSSQDELLMIEMKTISSQLNEQNLLDAINIASVFLKDVNILYQNKFEKASKEIHNVQLVTSSISQNTITHIKDNYTNDIKLAIKKLAKSERDVALKDLTKIIIEDKYCIENNIQNSDIVASLYNIKKDFVRDMILSDNIRPDGRKLNQVRNIEILTNILPSAHSSCLFTRGETQALVVGTLGGEKDAQSYDLLTNKSSQSEKFMVHYNFPGFSVGEAKPIFGVNRRELGHGNLAKRALEAVIDTNYTKTVRLVSEILESNGSSSMATVCGGSLALKAAGVPTDSLVAGVAMGGIFDNNDYAILTDITGLEDHDGDIDFKVAGGFDGITALQMDIKMGGIKLSILKEALEQAKEARLHILSLMQEVSNNIIPSLALPISSNCTIDTSKIMAVIGKGGATIREITEKFDVNVNINKDNGVVTVTSKNSKNIEQAILEIQTIANNAKGFIKKEQPNLTTLYNENEILIGKIARLADFGAFIELPNGGEGLLHISKISKEKVTNIYEVLNIGQTLELKILNVSNNRIELASTSCD